VAATQGQAGHPARPTFSFTLDLRLNRLSKAMHPGVSKSQMSASSHGSTSSPSPTTYSSSL
jgi:hypothetical protein